MKACTCGKASCALDRKRGGTCPGPHETPQRNTGAAVPTSSKFSALRRKLAAALNLAPPAVGLKPATLPTMGVTAATRAAAPVTGKAPTSPVSVTGDKGGESKLGSYQEIRRKIAAAMRGIPLRNARNAAASMTPADVAAQKAQFGRGAQAPQAAHVPLQPSGGQMFDFNPGNEPAPQLAPRAPRPAPTMFPSSR